MYPRKKLSTRPRRMKRVGRKSYRPRRRLGAAYHAPKKFESLFKLKDVIAAPYGTNPDGYTRNSLSVRLQDIPIFDNLFTLYKQFAITSVKVMYRPNLTQAFGGAATNTAAVSQILYVEDKDSVAPISPLQARSEDNCRVLTSNRPFKAFTKMPRPLLFQLNNANEQIKVIDKAKSIHWISPSGSSDTPESELPHLFAQMCVGDVTGAADNIGVGELWCKVYMSVKEQRKSAAV